MRGTTGGPSSRAAANSEDRLTCLRGVRRSDVKSLDARAGVSGRGAQRLGPGTEDGQMLAFRTDGHDVVSVPFDIEIPIVDGNVLAGTTDRPRVAGDQLRAGGERAEIEVVTVECRRGRPSPRRLRGRGGETGQCIGTIKALLDFRVKQFSRVLVPFATG